ncbi:MAG: aldo/keto reductase [Actinomycetota bacterium]|nr:aldo/keto reductase [Actinomycetota bacterium]
MTVPNIELNNGVSIPQLGFGVFQVPPEDTKAAVKTALETSYRHIDTARIYGNEEGVGGAIAESGIARDELFITTKLWNDDQGYESTFAAFENSLKRLGLDYVDLYLIHWPTPANDTFVDTWKAFEKLYADKRVRAIGVSNFRTEDLQRLIDLGLTVPAINQVELHPQLVQHELREFHAKHEIATEAWSPLAQGKVFTEKVIIDIAEAHGKSPAQIVIAWHLALGNVVIPKSVTPSRIAENLDVFGISLSEDEIAAITALDSGSRTGPDPAEFN